MKISNLVELHSSASELPSVDLGMKSISEMAIAVNVNKKSPKRKNNYLNAVARKYRFKFDPKRGDRVKGTRGVYYEVLEGTRKPLAGKYVYLIVDYTRSTGTRGFITHFGVSLDDDAKVVSTNNGFEFENGLKAFHPIPDDFVKFEHIFGLIQGVGDQPADDAEDEITGMTNRKVFDINKRFSLMATMIRMVGDLKSRSYGMFICGQGGIGKTHTVTTTLSTMGLEEDEGYLKFSGKMTSLELFSKFVDNPDGILVFDDCDSVLEDSTSMEFLKAALDTYKVRRISYLSPANRTGQDSVDFTGRVIFISNKSAEDVAQALRSRVVTVDVTMTRQEIIDRLKNILPHLEKDLDLNLRQEAFDFLSDFIQRNPGMPEDLNIRTLIKVINIRASDTGEDVDGNTWQDVAEYMLSSS